MWALPASPTSGRSVELPRRLQAVEVFRIAVREHLCRVSARDRQRRDFAVDDRTGLDNRPLADLRARSRMTRAPIHTKSPMTTSLAM